MAKQTQGKHRYFIWLLAAIVFTGTAIFARWHIRSAATSQSASNINDNGGNATDSLDDGQAVVFESGDVNAAIDGVRSEVMDLLSKEKRLGPKFVRLAFHDCIGGCNGCVDLSQEGHNGLGLPMSRLQGICTYYSSYLTRADCWALAALTSLEVMVPDNHANMTFPMEVYGRPTCPGSDSMGNAPDDILPPSPSFTTNEVLGYFATHFGFSDRETVAIMGAHTLGRLSGENSGFPDAQWVRHTQTLDNAYFTNLLDAATEQTEANGPYEQRSIRHFDGTMRSFWERQKDKQGGRPGGRGLQQGNENVDSRDGRKKGDKKKENLILLNSDVALISDLSADMNQATGEVGCPLQSALAAGTQAVSCPVASTFGLAQMYADSNNLWLQDFRTVFLRMLKTGINTNSCGSSDADSSPCFVGG